MSTCHSLRLSNRRPNLWPALAFFTAASKSTGRILMTRFWVFRSNAAHCHLGVFLGKKKNKQTPKTCFCWKNELPPFEMWARWNFMFETPYPRLHALHPRRLPPEPWIESTNRLWIHLPQVTEVIHTQRQKVRHNIALGVRILFCWWMMC